jgi:hypothetical protein
LYRFANNGREDESGEQAGKPRLAERGRTVGVKNLSPARHIQENEYMPRTPAGAVSKRAAAAAIRALEQALDDPKTPHYARIKAATALIDYAAAQAANVEPEKREPAKIIILPSNGRENIAEERLLARKAVAAQLAAEKAEPVEPERKGRLIVRYKEGKRR